MCFNKQTSLWLCGFYSFFVSLALILLIFWQIIFPMEIKFVVTDASLERFDLKNNSSLFYDLSINVTVKNPNKKVGVYFDHVEALASYRKKRFSATTLFSSTPFYLTSHKNTTLHFIFKGQKTLKLNRRDLEYYASETSSRVYRIDVRLVLQVRLSHGKIKSGQFKPPKIECDRLRLSFLSDKNGRKFRARMCKNVFILFSQEIDDDML